MFESILTTLATLVANKKVLGAWLVTLSLASAQIASSVYVKGNAIDAETKVKIDYLTETIEKMDKKLDALTVTVGTVKTDVEVLKAQKVNGKK